MMVLSPGATIGIIGGGQLGRMLAMAAARLGLKTCILEPQENCPAAQVANQHLVYAYDDKGGLDLLAEACDVITYEFENVPVEAARYLEERALLRPSSRALEIAQDRLVEKMFLNQCGIKTAQFAEINDAKTLEDALLGFDGRGILKTRRLGYDGKGQILFDGIDHQSPDQALEQLHKVPCILEEYVAFDREISIIAARGPDGSFAAYDPAENTHKDGILRTCVLPAKIADKTADNAVRVAKKIMEELSYIGVMGIEFFVRDDGSLLVNEFAPRVHNSGHWSEAACTISQFEQHIRAIAGWPLGVVTRNFDCVMENIIGDEVQDLHLNPVHSLSQLHLYGKAEVRAGRKMGHVTRLSPKSR
jgi:5-(carboxyamino)imidazole ribonucleotide synthase